MNWRAALSLTLLVGMVAWGTWLLANAKGTADYARARAATAPQMPRCEWVPVNSPSIASLGFSHDAGHAWSDRATAYIGMRVEALEHGAWLDVGVVAVANGRVVVEVPGNEAGYGVTQQGLVRLPVPPTPDAGTLLVTFHAEDMLPPMGDERRWLGIAIGRIRLCEAG